MTSTSSPSTASRCGSVAPSRRTPWRRCSIGTRPMLRANAAQPTEELARARHEDRRRRRSRSPRHAGIMRGGDGTKAPSSASPRATGSKPTFTEALKTFAETGELGALGNLRYVYAKKPTRGTPSSSPRGPTSSSTSTTLTPPEGTRRAAPTSPSCRVRPTSNAPHVRARRGHAVRRQRVPQQEGSTAMVAVLRRGDGQSRLARARSRARQERRRTARTSHRRSAACTRRTASSSPSPRTSRTANLHRARPRRRHARTAPRHTGIKALDVSGPRGRREDERPTPSAPRFQHAQHAQHASRGCHERPPTRPSRSLWRRVAFERDESSRTLHRGPRGHPRGLPARPVSAPLRARGVRRREDRSSSSR